MGKRELDLVLPQPEADGSAVAIKQGVHCIVRQTETSWRTNERLQVHPFGKAPPTLPWAEYRKGEEGQYHRSVTLPIGFL